MELTATMIVIIGVVSSFLTQIFKLIFDKTGWKPSSEWQIVILFVVGVALALAFFWQDFLANPITGIAAIMGVAIVIYELLLKKVVFPAIRLA